MQGRRIGIVFLVVSLSAAGAWGQEGLWRIGEKDGSAGEFAISAAWGEYAERFPEDCLYAVGRSAAERDWSYVLPGPADAWAGGRVHTFVVGFGLERAPQGGAKLRLDFVNTHASNPPRLSISVNGQLTEARLPTGGDDRSLNGEYGAGEPYDLTVEVAAGQLRRGTNFVTIANTGGSWCIFDSVRLEADGGAVLGEVATGSSISEVSCKPSLLRRGDGGEYQPATVSVVHFGPAMAAEVFVEKTRVGTLDLEEGLNSYDLELPVVEKATVEMVGLQIDGATAGSLEMKREPVRRWMVHIVPQTHLDIGYTHTQEEVLDLQVRQLHEAMEYVDAAAEMPAAARFKWHPEGMWAVDEFLRRASEEERSEFIEKTRRREIHLDVLYAQAMTGIYSEEELFELMARAKEYEQEYGVVIDSAMQSDVPGYTWGLSSVLAACGVKYLSVGPNYGHRVGHTFHWADRPFYWVAPNGRDKVLFWMAGRGYSLFQRSGVGQYGGLADNQLLKYMDDVFAYLGELEEQGYPYETVMVRYSIGSDNGPPDPTLAPAVEYWNERYASPRFVIDTNSNFLKTFEERHGDEIPHYSGDFTPYWEDGAASTSADLAIAREAAERLVQAQTLWSMRGEKAFPRDRFNEAWTNLIMYDEHTWGAWNSISDPENYFVTQQAAYKQQYALQGARITGELLAQTTPAADSAEFLDVYNTLYWDRTELVILSPEQSAQGDRVVDERGAAASSQRLASGELAFLAEEVPAFGARRYRVTAGEAITRGDVRVNRNGLLNGQVAVSLDSKTGAISSLKCGGVDGELADGALNDYVYILGRDADKGDERIEGPVRVTVEDAGGLVGTLRVESDAPGTNGLVRRIRLVSGEAGVRLSNVVDKVKERRPESVSFGFAFDVPEGVMKIDTPWAIWQPEVEQLPGANRNFFCVQRWVDISNEDRGVTWVTLDAPLVQWDPMRFGVSWNNPDLYRREIHPNQTLHSWVMNNHWETNYAADQSGAVEFRYVLWPHAGGYDAAWSQRVARSAHQPLLAFAASADEAVPGRLLSVSGDGVLVSAVRPARDGRGHVVRLYNTTNEPQRAKIEWLRGAAQGWLSDPMENRLRRLQGEIDLLRQEVATVRFEVVGL